MKLPWMNSGGTGKIEENTDAALKRWKTVEPDVGLTWNLDITGDAFVELASKWNCFSKDKSILELGPGYGRITTSIIGRNIPFTYYTGLDISEKNLNFLREKFRAENMEFLQGEFASVILRRKYDLVISSLTLKHQYPTFERCLKNISNYMNPGALCFFDLLENLSADSRKVNLLKKGPMKKSWEPDNTYIATYTKREVLQLLRRVGLDFIGFDHVTHDTSQGERLVVIARKPG